MTPKDRHIAIIGGGPAGLSAAEALSAAGCAVTVYERKPTLARKFLMAGVGGLNITHGEDFDAFAGRYGAESEWLRPALEAFSPEAMRAWCAELGEETFTGSSNRVFPKSFKASPLLRGWLARLEAAGVRVRSGRAWRGWDGDALLFDGPEGAERIRADAVVLALGGASWPRLGSDGGWVDILAGEGVALSPLRPANCGFAVEWSAGFRERFAGTPLKTVALVFKGRRAPGEALIARGGVEGGAVYALSAPLREAIAREGSAVLEVDLKPGWDHARLAERIGAARKGESLANILRKAAKLPPVAAALLREAGPPPRGSEALAARIKAAPVVLNAPQGLKRAISTAGGVTRGAVDAGFMLRVRPGVFVCGEMLDWEAPTGGYLLQACFATGRAAAAGALSFLKG